MEKIDVHHHMLPVEYVEIERPPSPRSIILEADFDSRVEWGIRDPQRLNAPIRLWTETGLGFVKSTEETLKLCRWVNEYAAKITAANPSRFGFFANLPPLDQVGPCLEELRYALDVLKADGVAVLSSYDDKYLSHPDFRPIWQELHHRNAVVFVHPTFAKTWGASSDPSIPRPIVDFPHETTRTAVIVIMSNTIRDCFNCRIILSHGGATLPYVATRIANQTADLRLTDKSADDFLIDTKSFYYDLALTGYEGPVGVLKEFAQVDPILCGSEFHFAREKTIVSQMANIRAALMNDEARLSIDCGAARKLFPRFTK